MTIWVGAGLGGLIVLAAGDIAEIVGGGAVPPVVTAVILTLIVVSAGTLALARVGFEWAATELERELHGQPTKERQKLPQQHQDWPLQPELMWRCSFYSIILAAVGFLVGVWWSVLS